MADIPINLIDLGVGLALLISAVLAFSRGFVHEVMSVAGWIGATFATLYGFPYLKPYARDYISLEIAADLTAGIIIFVVSLAILSIFTRAISNRVLDSALGAIDRSLGFLFGLARGGILVCLLFIVANMMLPLDGRASGGDKSANGGVAKDERPTWVITSRILPLIHQGANALSALIPPGDTGKTIDDTAGTAKNKAMEMLQKMTSPVPKSPVSQTPEGYGSKGRQSMDKAFESVQ